MKRSVSALALLAGGSLLCLSLLLVSLHIDALREMRETALPEAARIPPLQTRLKTLQRQVELAQLQASLRTAAPEEKLHVYVLPPDPDPTRLLAFFEVTRTFLERNALLQTMSPITLGDIRDADLAELPSLPSPVRGTLRAQPVSFTVTLKEEGVHALLSLLDLTGLLTVGDALTDEQVQRLFTLTEAQNAAGIVPMETFLSADLLSYVREPRLHDERLTRAFPSEAFLQEFRTLLQTSRLKEAKEFLAGPWGTVLADRKLWPLQFITVERVSMEEKGKGWFEVTLELRAYSREIH